MNKQEHSGLSRLSVIFCDFLRFFHSSIHPPFFFFPFFSLFLSPSFFNTVILFIFIIAYYLTTRLTQSKEVINNGEL